MSFFRWVRQTRAARMSLATFAGVALMAGIGAAPASAACAVGTACLWTNNDYQAGWGIKYGMSANMGSLWDSGIYHSASSGHANGGSCAATRFYSGVTSGQAYYDDDFFVLNSQTLVGGNYRDPNFSNGAGLNANGTGGGKAAWNWNDAVGSWWFTAC
ncbi:hypothetical protein [Antribacter gilvus]|uniref:hypothetical protein n=1 Tax=Antribacter gilvus TaxID=2304675 RepID=UPI000F773EEF|nr:hypothetical protein [Antribacter gilvus]